MSKKDDSPEDKNKKSFKWLRSALITRTPLYSQLNSDRQKNLQKARETQDPGELKKIFAKINTILPKLNKIRYTFEPPDKYVSISSLGPGELTGTFDIFSFSGKGPVSDKDLFFKGINIFEEGRNIDYVDLRISLQFIEYPDVKNVILDRITEIVTAYYEQKMEVLGEKEQRFREENIQKIKAWDLKQAGHDVDEIAVKLFPEDFPKLYVEMTPEERNRLPKENYETLRERFPRGEYDRIFEVLESLRRNVYRYIAEVEKNIKRYQNILEKIVEDQ